MSIVCQCPFCAKSYKLKDELAGKRVNCNNAKCGKSFPVPQPKEEPALAGPAVSNADLDALAAAALADEPVQEQPKEQQMIEVICGGCDHKWSVGIDKEGKNVQCPECRKVNRVPPRVQAKKVDWRGGSDGRPTYARREELPEVAGAFDAAKVATIGTETAREIVKSQEEPEEPSVIRKRWAKRLVFGMLLTGSLGGLGYYLATARQEVKIENSINKALEEVKNKEFGFGDKEQRFHAVVYRAAAEYHSRDAKTPEEYQAAIIDYRSARNAAKGAGIDQQAIQAEIALSIPPLLEAGIRVEEAKAKQNFLTELRQTLSNVSDPDLLHDTLRGVVKRLVQAQQASTAVEVAGLASQLGRGEAVGQVGLELVRLSKKAEAEDILAKNAGDSSPSLVALRLALGKPLPKDKELVVTRVAEAEAAALFGDYDRAKKRALATQQGKPDEKVRALLAVAHVVHESQPTQAIDALTEALKQLNGEAKGQVAPWAVIRACRLLGKVGKTDEADKLADTLPDAQAKAWGKLEAMRGKLTKGSAGNDLWLDAVGDPAKSLAAAKAREELARHNAAIDGSYQKTVDRWTKGTTRPFGVAGLILGQQDHDLGQ